MWILDFTSLLNNGQANYYTFNPSILHFEINKYLIAYRIASYVLPMQFVNPWRVWNSSYRLFKNPTLAASSKYRDLLGPSIELELKSSPINQQFPEFDNTGLAMVTFKNGKFTLEWNICDLFPNEMNQDARLQKIDNTWTIIYNVFDKQGVKLRCRDFKILDFQIKLTEERYLFNHIYRNIEKHACYERSREIIHYAFSERIINGQLITKTVSFFQYLYDKYGQENVLISLSTPSIQYQNNTFLAVGHAKFLYKQIIDFDFLSGIDISKIHKHGKYIYFMYLYEFSLQGDILNVSPMFIPTVGNCHLPYLLPMPIGLTKIYQSENILISYGEGDCKTKCLILNPNEIHYLLSTKSLPCFLSQKLSINHIGYFGKANIGDDAFQDVFTYLYSKTPHSFSFSSSKYNSNASLNILGGGDVINSYFIPPTMPHNTIAISVGIPYDEFNLLLKRFRTIYLRNEFDAKILKTSFAPDLTFLLPKIYGLPPIKIPKSKKSIGIILARTYYNKNFPQLYDDFIKEIAKFIEQLKDFHVVMIPFCTNKENPKEDDFLIIEDVCKLLYLKPEIFKAKDRKETYFKIADMDFNICSRFHSHIFSTIHAIPFISLTCGKKCIEYMKSTLPESLYLLKRNDIDLPIDFDGNLLFHFFKQQWTNRFQLHKKLLCLRKKIFSQIDVFETIYQDLIFKHAINKETILWLQSNKPKNSHCSSPEWNNSYIGMHSSKTLQPEFRSQPMQIQPIFQSQPMQMQPMFQSQPMQMQPMFQSQPMFLQIQPVFQSQMQPVQMQPVQLQPVQLQPVQLQPVFQSPVQMQPVQLQPVQMQPVFQSPVQLQPVQIQPVQLQPVQIQPVQMQPVQIQPAQMQPVFQSPIQIQPVQIQPVQMQPVQMQPVQIQPVQIQPAQMQPVQIQPVQMQPVQMQPVQIQPVFQSPVQMQPVQIQPVFQSPMQTQPEIIEPLNSSSPAYCF